METLTQIALERRRIRVKGIVQGVGFRPFVYRQAIRFGLNGWVRNDSRGVTIEVQGVPQDIDRLIYSMRQDSPALALIQEIESESVTIKAEQDFRIRSSETSSRLRVPVSADTSVCPNCLRELFDPNDRRYRYPFINCTNCGPRFTIVKEVPYDRANTTMHAFALCRDCHSEYIDPLDRRYHAQPNACPKCGPTLCLIGAGGQPLNPEDKIVFAAHKLASGEILAVKGLGGYHLACDANNEVAVRTLRQRKHRYDKPFALMVQDVATAQSFCEINEEEARLLESHRRPIVLVKQKDGSPVAPDIAANYQTLGLMLPYTPLHYLLLQAFAKAIRDDGLPILVMTSGNLSDEPIAYQHHDAQKRLFAIADTILGHDREIHIRCDDSVVQAPAAGPQILRRARGYVPQPITTSFNFPHPTLATGGHLKNTFCLARGNQVYVSHHIGDLENLETLTSFGEGIEHFQRLFAIQPKVVAYDLHPDYLATKYAIESDVPLKIGVQHHHAHIASVLAEHRIDRRMIGISADGTGYGSDGAIWGCEIMAAGLGDFERVAHLDYVPMPGGEKAVKQPWRMAAVYLSYSFGEAFLDLEIPFVRQLPLSKWGTLSQMITKNVNCPKTSSLGRLFDAVAALIGLRQEVSYEGQAAVELEMISIETDDGFPFDIIHNDPELLDVRPTIRAIVKNIQGSRPASEIAGKFHNTVAEMLAEISRRARSKTKLKEVALSGGVFQNRLLLKSLLPRLESFGFETYLNHKVPPNDGGLSLGQAAVAAARLNG